MSTSNDSDYQKLFSTATRAIALVDTLHDELRDTRAALDAALKREEQLRDGLAKAVSLLENRTP